jgi:hypothetical protein
LNPREGNLLCARKLPQNPRRVNRMFHAESAVPWDSDASGRRR